MSRREQAQAAAAYLLTGALSVAVAIAIIGRNNLGGPLKYDRDALWGLAYVKQLIETGSFWENPALAAPFGATYYDLPHDFVAEITAIRVLGLFSDDAAVVYNAYYLLGFACTAVAALWALRRLDAAWPPAIAGAVLFATLPFHFLRYGHLSLSNYYAIPLIVVCSAQLMVWPAPKGRRAWAALVAAALLIAIGPAYYVIFGAALALFSGAIGALRLASWKRAAAGLALCVGLLGVFSLSNIEGRLYQAEHGANSEVINRSARASEPLGMSLTELAIPFKGHRLAPEPVVSLYHHAHRTSGGEIAAYVGIVSLFGLAALVLGLFLRERDWQPDWWRPLAALSVFVFLLGTKGGIGSLFAWVVVPAVRSWNRISLVLAFLGVAAAVTLLQHVVSRLPESRRPQVLALASVALVAVGLFDQTSPSPFSAKPSMAYEQDRALLVEMEQGLPKHARVFQTPHVSYPEARPVHKEGHYAHLRGYLGGTTLRWSAGAAGGRHANTWLHAMDALPITERIAALQESGFHAVWVERRGFTDGGASIEAELTAQLGPPRWTRQDESVSVFLLKPTGDQPVDLTTAPQLASGFFRWEGPPGRRAWSRGDASLRVTNPTGEPHTARLDMHVDTLVPRELTVTVGSEVTTLQATPGRSLKVSLEFVAEPGSTAVSLSTDQPATLARSGARALAFSVRDATVTFQP
ncbi:MAG: hypothetical protein KC912_26830 [Proteobacteria bacterium]|nr:hypothetical protein [Pseudomonadota bacterium]